MMLIGRKYSGVVCSVNQGARAGRRSPRRRSQHHHCRGPEEREAEAAGEVAGGRARGGGETEPTGVVAGGEARGGGEAEPAGRVLAGGVVGPRDGIQEQMDLHFCLAVPFGYKTR